MKKLLAFLSIILISTACKQESKLPPNTYQVNVSAPGIYNGIRAHLKLITDQRREILIDTAIVLNETFSFEGQLAGPGMRVLSINGVKGNVSFILESGITEISFDKDSIQLSIVNGPENNIAYQNYLTQYELKRDKIKSLKAELTKEQSNLNRERFDQLLTEETDALTKLANHNSDFIQANSNLDLSLLLLENDINSRQFDLKQFKHNTEILEDVINRNAYNQLIGQKINTYIHAKEAEEKLNIGNVAPDFSSPDKDGNMLALKDMKGKATIIDFWAAWCGPCRRENPNVVKIYEKYHDKGLEIIGVSLDGRGNQKEAAKASWLKAIEDDGLNWHHVSSLKYFNDPVARLYNVNAIPATFILDKNGVIVAKKLRGQALEAKIKELLE